MKLVYDGNNTAYRCNCTTELHTKQGERVSAIYGVLNSIRYDIEQLQSIAKSEVTDVVFVWDFGKSSRRMALYPEYKGNRGTNTPEDEQWFEEFKHQANFLHENLHKFGAVSVRFKGWEADDLIYAVCKEMSGDKVIVSTDEDMLQLVREDVTVYSPIKKKFINNVNFMREVGVPLTGFLSYKLLKGDSSDNIPGIKGIGEKRGKELITKYGSLNALLRDKVNLEKSKVTQKIFTMEGLQLLERNNHLMNLTMVNYEGVEEELKENLS